MMRKSMKKWMFLFAILVLAFASVSVSAKTVYTKGNKLKTYKGSYYKVYYQGKLVTNSAAPAILINDNIMVPYQTAFVNNGPKMKAAYKASNKRVTLTLGKDVIKTYVNKKYIYINSKKKNIPTAPLVANVDGKSYIMVPAKAIMQGFGYNYVFSKKGKAVYITKPVVAAQKEEDKKVTQTAAKTPAQSNPAPAAAVVTTNLTAKTLSAMSTARFIQTLGPIAQADYKRTGVLASVTLAQAINESGWGKTVLAQKGNNIFGMKIRLSENTWEGSVWDGKSYVTINTKEEYRGKKVTISAKFRKYRNIGESVADHSAYLVYAKNGSKRRYAGLTATKSYAKQLSILQKGGYCTWSSYVSELTSLIKKYNLTRYDVK